MPILTIRERQKTEAGFAATVSFDGAAEYPFTVTDPFTPEQEAELEWYFEQWLVYPMLHRGRAEQAGASVKAYGERLFEQVFADRDAYSEYRAWRERLAEVQIEIVGDSPEFQALHWEALREPGQPRALAVDAVMLRKRVQPAAGRASVEGSPLVNLLVVTARPGEENDVGYRTISRPLIEAIERGRLRVNVELLRPATFEALTEHLEDKAGFYHIIHLDLHGAVMSYEQAQASLGGDAYRFRFGQVLEPFEGVRGFLAFESGAAGRADLRQAQELADLLTGKGIPVCILNACQSAKQVRGDERETSLGAALMAAGMQMVVAMGYSVTVSAAEILMQTLYEQLFAEAGLQQAMRLGRKALWDRKERRAYFNQMIRLEDWLLPVVYAGRPVDLRLREFTPQEEADYWQQQELAYRFQPPTYGFVGRDLEILKIERSLLRSRESNLLLVQGMGGTGKTTLLNYLRQWWQQTRFVKDVFYFGYDQRAYTLAQILFEIGQRVYPRYEAAQFQAMPLGAQVAKLVATLRAEPYGLMLDNLESVTGQALAIQNTLTSEQQAELKDFLQRLLGGKTKVVLGSRSREVWLESVLRGVAHELRYELRGLDQESRTSLAERILARQVGDGGKIAQIRADEDFKRLMKLLAGYPLAMEVVLGNLRRQSPSEILAALDAADLRLDSGSEEKTASILKCVEYSHSNLSPEAQRLLVCLAPFSGFIDRRDLENYGKQLQPLAPFQDYPFEQFDAAVQEAIDWGLLSPLDADNSHLLTIQPVFPYFLKTKLNQLDAATREALTEGFKNHYRGLAGYYEQLMDSKDPQQRRTGIIFCRLEYENLYNALKICLEKQGSIEIFFCLGDYFDVTNNPKSQLELSKVVCAGVDNYPDSFRQGKSGHQIAFAYGRKARSYLELKQYSESKIDYERTIEIYDSLKGLEERQKQLWKATSYHQLGRVAQEQRQYEEAQRYFQQALQLKIEFNDRYSQARTYHNLGSVAQEQRQYEEAQRYFQQALQLKIEFNDRYSQASTYHQLGSVAQEQRQYEEAQRYFQQALQIYIEFNDRYSQARTYHQLGIVAQEQRQYEEAQRYYQQALQLKIEFNDRYSQASTYGQLGLLAEAEGNLAEATANLQQALVIFKEFGDEYMAEVVQRELERLAP